MKFSYTFASGLEVKNATFEQLITTATSLGEPLDMSKLPIDPAMLSTPGYYYSKSKNHFIRLKDMADTYLHNAYKRALIDYTQSIDPKQSPKDFVKAADISAIPVLVNLFTEIVNRAKL